MKAGIVAAILEQLHADFSARRAVSKKTRAAGNDAESKAESKYDTLAIEENYLADGLAKQAIAAAGAAASYENLPLPDFGPDDPIDLGALIEMEFADGREWFFLGPAGGGITVHVNRRSITVITPESALGRQMMDRKAGDALDRPVARIRRVQ